MSDTSPLRALQALGLVGLLELLYGEVLIPPAVAAELRARVEGLAAFDVERHVFLRVQAPKELRREGAVMSLGPGEAEAIALALEVGADTLLIDERKGRKVAQGLGLSTTGVLALLVEAKERGYVEAVAPLLDRLAEAIDFRVSAELRARILKDANEL